MSTLAIFDFRTLLALTKHMIFSVENKDTLKRWLKAAVIVWLVGVIVNLVATYAVSQAISTLAKQEADYRFVEEKATFGAQTLVRRDVPTGPDIACNISSECNFGECLPDGASSLYYCECDEHYLSLNDEGDYDISEPCNYEQKSGLVALLLSIFIGSCGVDRCYLARGNAGACCCGVCKGLTLGALGIWTIIDVILIAVGSLNDGNGISLTDI